MIGRRRRVRMHRFCGVHMPLRPLFQHHVAVRATDTQTGNARTSRHRLRHGPLGEAIVNKER